MSGRKRAHHDGGTRRYPRSAQSAAVRLHDLPRISAARRQRRSLYRRARTRTPSRPGIFPARIFSICRANSPIQSTELRFMMPACRAARGRVRPSRRRRRQPGRALLASARRCGRRGSGGCSNRWALTTSRCSMAVSTNGRPKAARSKPGRRKDIQPATFTAKPKRGFFVDKHDVLAAARRAQHRGRQRARPAIPQGPGAEPLRPARPRSRQLQRVGGDAARSRRPRPSCRSPTPKQNSPRKASRKDKRVVAYCGGGISATIDLFLLHRLGYDNLTLYDGSMGEWAKDDVAADRDGVTSPSPAHSLARSDLQAGTFGSGTTFGSRRLPAGSRDRARR